MISTITGTVTSVLHRINRTGQRWATATITGEHDTEVLVFPKYYAMVTDVLTEGAVVAVTGRAAGGDLFAWEITSPRGN